MRFKKAFLKIVLILVAAFIVSIAVLAVLPREGEPMPPAAQDLDTTRHNTVAVFGATGSVGDGLLKAAVNDPEISKSYIITRRSVPRIEEAVASGKAEMITHMDYLDYAPLRNMLAEVDSVFWAIGITARAVSKEQYGVIQFVFEPFKLTVRSTVIGRAMLEVSARGDELPHGTILENQDIRRYGAGYSERVAEP